MKIDSNSSNGDRHTNSSNGGSSYIGKQINGNLMVCDFVDNTLKIWITKTFEKLQLDMEAKDAIEYDDNGGHNGQSRKRKEPDSSRDEDSNSLNLANAQRVWATKSVNPSSLFTSQRL